MGWLVSIILSFTLIVTYISWYESKPEAREQRKKEERECLTPVLISETEDGVKLWRVGGSCTGHQVIYFSSRGTSWERREGKTTKNYQVPNAEGAKYKK